MRDQPTLIAALIASTCLVRFALGAIGFMAPVWLFGLDPVVEADSLSYIVRLYAVRDVVLSLLLVSAAPSYVVPVLIGCIAVDAGDLLAAILAGTSGSATSGQTVALVALSAVFIAIQATALQLIRRRMQSAG